MRGCVICSSLPRYMHQPWKVISAIAKVLICIAVPRSSLVEPVVSDTLYAPSVTSLTRALPVMMVDVASRLEKCRRIRKMVWKEMC